MNLRKNNIVMLGMTGVGKTTIGKILSKVIKAKFIDIDYEIEKASNLKVYDFFSQYGENEFRKLEKKVFLKSLSNTNKSVISTGAGILSDNEIISSIQTNSLSIFLDIKISNLVERLKYNLKNRPKLKKKNLKENLETMYKSRISGYNQANLKITVDGLSAADVVSRIVKKLNNYDKF